RTRRTRSLPPLWPGSHSPETLHLMLSLLAAAESHRDWALTVIEDLVRLESPSTDKASLDRVGAEIARLFVELGARATALPQERSGDHLRIEIGRGDEPGLVLGHFDT